MSTKTGKPKLLIIDIETAPSCVYSWGLWNQNIGVNQIKEPGYVLCFAAKWYGEDEMIFQSVYHDGRAKMLDTLWDLFNDADGVVGYNSAAFDTKWVNSEFLEEGFCPPTPYRHIDLLKAVRQNFKGPSNKLEFIANKLDIGEKLKHQGFHLWRGCMDNDPECWETMREYNIHDVELTEDLFEILKPWANSQVNFSLYSNSDELTCKHCGSTDLTQVDDFYTKTATYDQYQCNDCGGYSRSRKRNQLTRDGVLV